MEKTLHLKRMLRAALLVLLFGVACMNDVWAQNFIVGDLIYMVCEKEEEFSTQTIKGYVTVTGYADGFSDIIDIPSSVVYENGTYTVESIQWNAFNNCSRLVSFTIPNSVKFIGENAFKNTGWYNNQPDGILYLDGWCVGYKGSKPTGSVEIREGTRGIGRRVFSDCSGLLSLSIPNSVVSLERDAFVGTGWYNNQPDGLLCLDGWCMGWKGNMPSGSLTIPEGVKRISANAFSGEYQIESLIIPNTVVSIGENAFRSCRNMLSVTFGGSTKYLERDAFRYCSILNAVYYSGNVEQWCELSFEDSFSNPLRYANNLYINGVLITNLIIPNSVTEIAPYAFYACTSLTSVNLSNSVVSLGKNAFYACSGLTELFIPRNVNSMGYNTFNGCRGLNRIVVDSSNPYYDSRNNCNAIIETNTNKLLLGCNATVIPNTVAAIGNLAFANFDGLKSIVIPESVESIGYSPFSGCDSLTSVVVETGNRHYNSGNNCNAIIETNTNTLVVGCKNTVIPNTVTRIGRGAFASCACLNSILIPNSVSVIEDLAFYYTGLSGTLFLPNSVTRIGDRSFMGCSGLNGVFLPRLLESMGRQAFYSCMNLSTVVALGSVPPSIVPSPSSDATFYGTGNPTLTVACGNKQTYESSSWNDSFSVIEEDCNYYAVNIENGEGGTASASTGYAPLGAVISLAFSPLPFYELLSFTVCSANDQTRIVPVYGDRFVMPNFDVVVKPLFSLDGFIVDNLMYGINDDRTSVTVFGHVGGSSATGQLSIPDKVTYENVVYTVTGIANNAFRDYNGLTSVSIPNTILTIGDFAFYGCRNITSVIVPTSLRYLGSKSFGNCSRLNNIYYQVEQGLESGELPFSDCPNLTTIHIDPTVLEIGSNIFKGCNTVHFVVALGPTPAVLDAGAFSDIVDNSVLMVSCGNRVTYYSVWNMFPFNSIIEDCNTYPVESGVVGSGGNVSLSSTEAQMGDEVQITINPNSGMVLSSLVVSNASDPTQIIPINAAGKASSTYSFTMPPFGVVVMASFETGTTVSEINNSIPAMVYPNPTSGNVRIEASDLRHVSIFNALGQQVYESSVNGDVFECDLTNHEAGIYLIRLETANGIATKRVVLMR